MEVETKQLNIRKQISFFLKILITGIILFFIFRKIDFNNLLNAFLKLQLSTISLLIISSLMKFYTQYRNWERYLTLDKSYQPKRDEILKSHLIGSALRFLIPGGYASLGKILYINHKKRYTAFSIGAERLVQTWVAVWCGVLAAFFYYSEISLSLRWLLVLVTTFLPVIFIAAVSFHPTKKILLNTIYRLTGIIGKLRKNKAPLAVSVKDDWEQILGNTILIFPSVLTYQLLFIFLTVCQYFFIVTLFSPVSFFDLLMTVPLILTANIIPVTYAGLGLRETFSIRLLHSFNVLPEVAVAASLIIFFLNSVVPALIGSYYLIKAKRINN